MLEIQATPFRASAEIDNFLNNTPDALIYHTPRFATFLTRAIGGEACVLVARRDSDIVGILPYCLRRDSSGRTLLNSLPWYGSHGSCCMANSNDHEARKALIEAYTKISRADNIAGANLILPWHEERWLEPYKETFQPRFMDERIGQVTHLPPNIDPENCQDVLLSSVYGQKTRNLVRKSLKQGFELVHGKDEDWAWEFLFETHVENIQAVGGKHKPWSHFQAMREVFPETQRPLLIARLNDSPVAAMLLLHHAQTVEYITPVIKVEYRSQQPLSFLIHQGMQWAVSKNFTTWNWGGTWKTQLSLRHFKNGWGATEYPYHYLIHATDSLIDRARTNLDKLAEDFPYYYLLPFSALEESDAI